MLHSHKQRTRQGESKNKILQKVPNKDANYIPLEAKLGRNVQNESGRRSCGGHFCVKVCSIAVNLSLNTENAGLVCDEAFLAVFVIRDHLVSI